MRPWRAVAYLACGPVRLTVAKTSRASEAAVARWADEQRASGYCVDVWEVVPIPEVAAATARAQAEPVA